MIPRVHQRHSLSFAPVRWSGGSHLRPARALTLLEVLLAVTIFAILGVIILSTFRTGTRAYEDVERQATLIDEARFVFDQLEHDVHGTLIKREAEYNQAIRQQLDQIQKLMFEAEWMGDWDEFQQRTGYNMPVSDLLDDEGRYPEGYLGNPLEKSILVDLAMFGEPNGDDATFSFVVRKPVVPGRPYDEWGLTRVTYTSQEGVLIRSEESVEDPPRDLLTGDLLVEPPPPRQEVVAQGVKRFSLRFGYWFDEVWLESTRWNSTRKEFRNSFDLWTPDPDPDKADALNQPGSPEWQQQNQLMSQAPEDRVPAYVRVILELADVKNPKRTEVFTTIIRYPQSEETYVPNNRLDEERRDEEIDARLEMSGRYARDSGSFGVGGYYER